MIKSIEFSACFRMMSFWSFFPALLTFGPLTCDGQDRHAAEQEMDDSDNGEEGEEEEPKEGDAEVDPDRLSGSAFLLQPAPAMSLGTVTLLPPSKRKGVQANSKKKAKKEEGEEDEETPDVVEVKDDEEIAQELMAVRRLKMIITSTGTTCASFHSLVPDNILKSVEKPGRSIRGVPCLTCTVLF